MLCPYKTERPIDAFRDADAGRDRCFKDWPVVPAANSERPIIQPVTIQLARDAKGLRQFSWSIGKGRRRAHYLSPFIHERQPAQRL